MKRAGGFIQWDEHDFDTQTCTKVMAIEGLEYTEVKHKRQLGSVLLRQLLGRFSARGRSE